MSAYLTQADEKTVHDLRTSTRRVLTGIQLLPRKLRDSKQVAEYVATLEKLMKANAKTRDIDIVVEKIKRKNAADEYDPLLRKLGRVRKSSVLAGRITARELSAEPRIPVRIRSVSGSSLQRRFEKLSGKYASRIEKRLPGVLTNPDKKDELHRLREDARSLRYTLELGEKQSDGRRLKVLRSWQDVLGDIHDSDIFIQHFEGSDSADEKSLVDDEIVVRNRNYEKFRLLAKLPFKLES